MSYFCLGSCVLVVSLLRFCHSYFQSLFFVTFFVLVNSVYYDFQKFRLFLVNLRSVVIYLRGKISEI